MDLTTDTIIIYSFMPNMNQTEQTSESCHLISNILEIYQIFQSYIELVWLQTLAMTAVSLFGVTVAAFDKSCTDLPCMRQHRHKLRYYIHR